jgi:hypothetical protein
VVFDTRTICAFGEEPLVPLPQTCSNDLHEKNRYPGPDKGNADHEEAQTATLAPSEAAEEGRESAISPAGV